MDLAQTFTADNNSQLLAYMVRDDDTLAIYQKDNCMWLQINDIVQSAIELTPPYRPLLAHNYVMLLPMLHHKKPNRVLELGGGGLCLQRYLHCSQPDIKVTSVEIDSDIINLTQEHFPKVENQRLIHNDALTELNQQNKLLPYDWLIIDVFNGNSIPKFLQIIDAGLPLLNNSGWLIVNMLDAHHSIWRPICESLNQQRAKQWLLPVKGMKNLILLAYMGTDCLSMPEEITNQCLLNQLS